MTLRARAKATTLTLGFWIGLIVTVSGAVQTSLSFIQPVVSQETFGIINFIVGVVAMTFRFIETKVDPDPNPETVRDHDGLDGEGQ